MSALSRRKGREWQAALARRWRDLGLWIAARSTQGEQVRSGALGPKPADVEGTPFAVEAKHRRACRPLQALEQSEAEAEARADWRDAIAVVKPHGAAIEDAVVVMRLTTFETLARASALDARCRASLEEQAAPEADDVMHGEVAR